MRSVRLLPYLAMACASFAQAQSAVPHQPINTAAFVRQVCAPCHGADGNSARPDVPSLAGQVEAYLEGQLRAFAAQGEQRANGVMGAIAVNLSADEMKRASLYFARQPLRPAPSGDPRHEKRAKGERIFNAGLPAHGVASCASCHGTSAQGLPDAFPRLAGQHAPYVATQLRHFRSGARTSDADAVMRKVAASLSNGDIDALSAYVASLR